VLRSLHSNPTTGPPELQSLCVELVVECLERSCSRQAPPLELLVVPVALPVF
jgi:hypothetical protein